MKFISRPLIISALMLASSAVNAAPVNYKLDASHTAVTWQVTHMGLSHPTGKFMNIEGVLVLDEEKPENSTLNVNIPVAKQDSGVPALNEHMLKSDFLDAEKFPTATFKSSKVELTGKDTAKVTGDMNLRGVTKPVTLDVKLNGIMAEHPMTKKKFVGFSATTTIKRSDFGMGYGIPMVSDEVILTIESEAGIVE